MAITLAPPHLANETAKPPTVPAPPDTNTTLPETLPSAKTQRWAVRAGMPRAAPASKPIPSGTGTACAWGRAVYWAAVPKGLPLCVPHTHTLWPTREDEMPSPTSSIVPAPSLWGMTRG